MNQSVPRVQAVVMDVDGVLTDGGVFLGPEGPVFKRISFRDVMGVSLGRKAGLRFALVSGEGGPILGRIAAQFNISVVYPNCKDKAAALIDFVAREQLPLEEVCFLGDDVNDLPAMTLAGHTACPSDAHPVVLAQVTWVLGQPGGHGAVRELVDRILNGAWA